MLGLGWEGPVLQYSEFKATLSRLHTTKNGRRRSSSKPKKGQKAKPTDSAACAADTPPLLLPAEQVAIAELFANTYLQHRGPETRGWTPEKIQVMAKHLIAIAADTTISRLRFKEVQFCHDYFAYAGLWKFGEEQYLRAPDADVALETLRKLRASASTNMGKCILQLPQGSIDFLSDYRFRAQLERAFYVKEEGAWRKNEDSWGRRAGGAGPNPFHDFLHLYCYASSDEHGSLGLTQTVNTLMTDANVEFVIDREKNDQSDDDTAYCYTVRQVNMVGGGVCHLVSKADGCATAQDALARLRQEVGNLGYSKWDVGKAKAYGKAKGRIKAWINSPFGMLAAQLCCKASAERVAMCLQTFPLYALCSTSIEYNVRRQVAIASAATTIYGGDDDTTKMPVTKPLLGDADTPGLRLAAVQRSFEYSEIKDTNFTKKVAAGGQFFDRLDEEQQFNALVWQAWRESMQFKVRYAYDNNKTATYTQVLKHGRVGVDGAFKQEYLRLYTFLAENLYVPCYEAAGLPSCDAGIHNRVYVALQSKEYVPMRTMRKAFRNLHEACVRQHGKSGWETTFAKKELHVPGRNGQRTYVYTSVDFVCWLFDRLHIGSNAAPLISRGQKKNLKLLTVVGGDYDVLIPTVLQAKWGQAKRRQSDGGGAASKKKKKQRRELALSVHDECCAQCKHLFYSGSCFVRRSGACGYDMICFVCKFREIGPFDYSDARCVSKNAGTDSMHSHPVWWWQHSNYDWGSVFTLNSYNSCMANPFTDTDEEEEDADVGSVRFKLALNHLVVESHIDKSTLRGRDVFASAVPLTNLELDDAIMRTVVYDHKPAAERGEAVPVAVFASDQPPQTFTGYQPTEPEISQWFRWMTLANKGREYAKYVFVPDNPPGSGVVSYRNGQMDNDSLKRSFAIFKAERARSEVSLLAQIDSYTNKLEEELEVVHALNDLLGMDEEELDDAAAAACGAAAPASAQQQQQTAAPAAPAATVGGDGGTCGALTAY